MHRARDTKLKRIVALKRVRPEDAEDASRMAGLLEEARAAAALNHPNVVRVHDVEEDAGGGGGRLQRVHQSGRSEVLCTGFYQLEDVAVDADGWLYVSEDTSGWVIAVEPPREEVYLPLLPRRLAYPELLPTALHPHYFYDDFYGLVALLAAALKDIAPFQRSELQAAAARFDWRTMAPVYDAAFEKLA